MANYKPYPVAFTHGQGVWLFDEQGNRYLDALSGIAVCGLGHANQALASALHEQANKLIHTSNLYQISLQEELASILTELAKMDKVFFCNSGAEANEVAVKLARKWGKLHKAGAFEVVTTVNGFHGRTMTMMAASGKPGWEDIFPPYTPGFKKVPFGDIDQMRDAISAQTVAIMVEPVQGEAGVVVPPDGYLQALRELADQHDLLLIFDEIQTGLGRLGAFTAAQLFSVTPDIMTLGKGIGNGLPLSATLSNSRADCFEHGDQGGTYNGNPLMTHVGQAVVSVVQEPAFLDHVAQAGKRLRTGLNELLSACGGVEVRGHGLLCAIRLSEPVAPEIVARAFDRGLLINAARPDILRFMPSLRVTDAEIEEFFVRFEQAL